MFFIHKNTDKYIDFFILMSYLYSVKKTNNHEVYMPQILIIRNSAEMKNILDSIEKFTQGDKSYVQGAIMPEDAKAIMQQLFDSGILKTLEDAGIHHIMVPTPQGVLTGLSSEGNMDMLKNAKKCSCGTCTCKDTPKAAPKSKSKDDTSRLEKIVGDFYH